MRPGISRRQAVGGVAAATATMLSAPSVHAQSGRRTLRFIPQAGLKILDPVWTTAYLTRNHAYLVYDTLFGTDENLQVKPQMVDRATVSPDAMKYTFALRDGLRWHDGQPVLSEDCVESLKRWGKKDRFGQLLMAHTGKIAPVDKKTFTLELSERFGLVLDALGKPSRATDLNAQSMAGASTCWMLYSRKLTTLHANWVAARLPSSVSTMIFLLSISGSDGSKESSYH